MKQILDHVADPIFVKDRQHRWIYGNKAFWKIMGLSPGACLGKSDYDFFPKKEADVFWAKDNAVFASDEVDINEEHLTDAKGKRHTISTKKSRFFIGDNKEPVLVGIIRDITAVKEVEQMKDEFISMVSHELRTPLTSIRAALELLASGRVCALPDDAASMLNIACRNSERLEHIINEILDLEKIESGKMTLQIEGLPVAEFLSQALVENEAYGKKYGVTFELVETPEDLVVMADSNKLMRVIANLLSNAAKFSHAGARVYVCAMPANGNCIRFEVVDSGIGIPEKLSTRIFEKFSQVDGSSTRKREGAGLGLNITKKLVEAMKGSISFTSREGEGTTFFVELPAGASSHGVRQKASP